MPYGSGRAPRRGDVAKRSASEPLRGALALPAHSDHFFLATTRTISKHCLA
jgi:hypothetical protein